MTDDDELHIRAWKVAIDGVATQDNAHQVLSSYLADFTRWNLTNRLDEIGRQVAAMLAAKLKELENHVPPQ